jgi:hypothetical protein
MRFVIFSIFSRKPNPHKVFELNDRSDPGSKFLCGRLGKAGRNKEERRCQDFSPSDDHILRPMQIGQAYPND